ncbi:MAG: PAS domain-containing protein, partial [Bacteroidota bacterium]
MLASVGQALIAADVEGKVTYWNHIAEDMFGLSADEAIGLSLLEAAPNDKTPEELGNIMGKLMEGKVWTGVCRFLGKNGQAFPGRLQDSPVLNEEGQFIG